MKLDRGARIAAPGGRKPIMPKLDTRGEHIRPLMPGDPGYDEIY